jgi:hypothetical protein
MPKSRACYRDLHNYKYVLAQDYVHPQPVSIKNHNVRIRRFIDLKPDGRLTVKKGYAWDGASGPAIDTPSIMRGSLVHDALYQLMRMKKLDHKKHRKPADKLFRKMCLADRMSTLRAGYVYQSVRWFGLGAAKPPETTGPNKNAIICSP